MKIAKYFRNLLAVFLLAVVFAISNSSGLVHAEDGDKDAYRMAVTPAKAVIEEKLEPGEAYEGDLEVKNNGKNKFSFTATPMTFAINDEGDGYVPVFDKANDYNKMREWVTVTTEKTELEPGESVNVHYIIEVPEGANSGGQYAAILVRMSQNEDEDTEGAGFKMSNQIGFVIYAEVDGEINKTGIIKDNKTAGFRFSPPISATSVVENTGNTHFTAKYIFQVLPFFGGEELYTNEEEPKTALILPDTSYMNTMTWDDTPSIGIFKVRQTVQLNDEDNTESTIEKIVIVCPVWLIFVIVLVIFVLIFWIVSRIRGRNKE